MIQKKNSRYGTKILYIALYIARIVFHYFLSFFIIKAKIKSLDFCSKIKTFLVGVARFELAAS